jgi:hypothetical protein
VKIGLVTIATHCRRRIDDPRVENENVPPFQGGTWEHSMRKAVGVNAAQQRFRAIV